MAARSDAATDRVSRTSSPATATVSIMGWAKISSAGVGSFNPLIRLHFGSGGNSSLILGFKGTNGRTPSLYSPSNSSGISGSEIALSTYIFVCGTVGAAGAAQIFYGTTPGTVSKATGTVAVSGTPDGLTVFSRAPGDGSEWLDGTIAHMRIYEAVLSDAEVAAESASATPVRTSNLWACWPFASASLSDTSGNARNLTAGTTALASDTDPTLGSSLRPSSFFFG